MRITLHLREHIALVLSGFGGAMVGTLAVAVFRALDDGGRSEEFSRAVASLIVASGVGLMFMLWSLLSPLLPKRHEQAMFESLYQQLEQECATREAAEAEAADLRRQLESSTASLDDAKTAYEALRRENRKLHNGWDAAQVESTRKGKELAAVTAELERLHLKQDRAVQQGAEAEQDATGAKPSHLLAIAALVELLKSPVDRPRPQGMNQEAIKAAILEGFPWRGLSDRNLQTIFAAANKAKADAG